MWPMTWNKFGIPALDDDICDVTGAKMDPHILADMEVYNAHLLFKNWNLKTILNT